MIKRLKMNMELKKFIEGVASAPRVSGTQGEEKALSFIEECIESIGFSAEREDFNFEACIPQESHLQVGDAQLEVLPLGYSKSDEVIGKIAFIESLESELLEGLGDCIVVYPENIYERSEYESLLSSNIRGILLALGDRLADVPTYTAFPEEWLESGRVVAATIGKGSLRGISSSNEAILVSRSEEKLAQSSNLVWDLGIDSDEDVYIFAHHDSAPHSWGVTDNACGVAVLLRACELLKEERPTKNVIFATFGAHELKGATGGSRAFLRKRLSALKTRGSLAINIDVQGYRLGQNRVICNVQWLADAMSQLKYRLKYPVSTEVRCTGPIDSFYFQKYVPTITFQRTGYYSHSRLGNMLDIVDYESIERTARATKELVLGSDKREIKKEDNERIVKEMGKFITSDIYDL
jgi:Iap family predicted aminopeptidase